MYFKDNVSSTSSAELVKGFIIVPSLIIASIILVHWQYKKQNKKANEDDASSAISSHMTPKRPLSHDVFMHSYVCLPEGEHFKDIIENSDDLTVLSSEYTSLDNLPILIKPIANIVSNDEELYLQEDDIDSITRRICLIIDHLLIQNTKEIDIVVNQFVSKDDTPRDKNNQDVTLSMHPKWQQSHILSENNNSKSALDIQSLDTQLNALPIYLILPELANKPYIANFTINQLVSYGFTEDVLDIRSVPIESSDKLDSQDQNELITPLGVIKNHIIDLSQNIDPRLSLVIGVDSQINAEWIEEYYYTSQNTSSIVPEEAGVMLFVMNKHAASMFEIENLTATSMLEFPIHSESNTSIEQSPPRETHYASNIRSISNFLQLDLLTELENDSKTDQVNNTDQANGEQPLAPFHLTILSDISQVYKPYNLTVFMRFVDNLIYKGARIDEHHMGGYIARNEWMGQLISLSLYSDIESEHVESDDDDSSNKTLLITHDKTDTLLWMTTTTVNI